MESIGNRLKFFRKKKNLNQGELAVKLGVTQATVSKIEKGIREPTEPLIKLLEYTFGLNKEWLLTGKGEMYYASCGGEPPKEGEGSQYQAPSHPAMELREPVAPYGKDTRLTTLMQKLEHIYKEGTTIERGQIRGIIEELYEDIKKKETLPKEEVIEQKKVG